MEEKVGKPLATKIPVILIGLGRIASLLEQDPLRNKPCSHAGVLFSSWGRKFFALQHGVDPDPLRRKSFAKQWNLPESILIESSETEIQSYSNSSLAIIATPSASHFPIAMDCLDRGAKYLLVEKPVALGTSQAKILKAEERKKKATIWVNHERRYHPTYQQFKAMLDQGLFGFPKRVVANVFTSSRNPGLAFSESGGGPLFHDGTHALDLLQWMFPKMKLEFSKVFRKSPKENPGRVLAWFSQKETEILFEVSGARDYFQFELEIYTNNCRIVLSNDGFLFWKPKRSPLYKGFQSLQKEVPPFERKGSAFTGIYKEIQAFVSGKTLKRECSLEDNLKILQFMEEILQGKNA